MKATGRRLCSMVTACMLLTAAVPVNTLAADGESTTIRIIHTNDLHGYYTATGRGQIGFAALKTLIDQQEADLVLDIGDTFHGQAFATVEKGRSMAELLDAVGCDAMTPGNHDWSYGAERLRELDAAGSFAVLAANVVNEDDGSPFFDTPYLVKTVEADDGTQLKVGVVGVIDDAFYNSTVPDNVAGLEFTEEAAQAAETARILREQESCDIVIGITHQKDCQAFVAGISGIDAVIAGHEHIVMDEAYPDREGKRVPVVEAGYYFLNVGVLSLTFDPVSGTVSEASETIYTSEDTAGLEDRTVAGQITAIEEREAAVLQEPVGFSSEEYPYSWEEVRVSEQAIGRIVTAAYLDWTGADVAMENAGGIRSGVPKGRITYADLISISPYGNMLVLKKLTGQQILDIMEYSLEINRVCGEVYELQKKAVEQGEDPYQYSWPDDSGSALQFGGVQAEYDMEKPAGSRVSNALIGGRPLEPGEIYTVAANNYVAENTDYPAVADAELLSEYGTCEETLRRYIGKGEFEQAAVVPNLAPVNGGSEPVPTITPEPTGQVQPTVTVEPVPTGQPTVTTRPVPTGQPEEPADSGKQISQLGKNTPATGDNGTVPWASFLLLSGGTLLLLSVRYRKSGKTLC